MSCKNVGPTYLTQFWKTSKLLPRIVQKERILCRIENLVIITVYIVKIAVGLDFVVEGHEESLYLSMFVKIYLF